jgi:hypothetical protein
VPRPKSHTTLIGLLMERTDTNLLDRKEGMVGQRSNGSLYCLVDSAVGGSLIMRLFQNSAVYPSNASRDCYGCRGAPTFKAQTAYFLYHRYEH